MHLGARGMSWLALVVVGATAAGAWAQSAGPTLATRIMSADRQWSASERERARQYIDQFANQLRNAAATADITQARQKLIEPLQSPGATSVAKDQYSAIAATAIEPAMQRDNALARLSTTIVAGSLFGGHAIDMVTDAMTDQSVAVRYWAFKAAEQMVRQTLDDRPVLTEQQQDQLLQGAIRVVGQVGSGDVREQMYMMMAQINSPASRTALMEAMEARLEVYASDGLSEGLRAERTGISRLYRTMLEAQIQGRASREQIKLFVRVATRYLKLIADASADGIAPAQQPICTELVDAINLTLQWGMGVFDPAFSAATAPRLREPFVSGVAQGRTAEFRLNVEAWVDLVAEATGLSRDQLTLPAPE